MLRIAVIPGDGVGPEIAREAVRVIGTLADCAGKRIETVDFDLGADRFLKERVALPPDTLERFRSEFDAILMGPLGDPRIPDMKYAAEIVLGIRAGLDLFANVRPVKLLARRLSPLKNVTEADINFTVFRENTEGLYVGIGGIFKKGTPDEIAIHESISTRKGVERIMKLAFSFAAKHHLKKVTMADKCIALPYGGDLWQRTFQEVASGYPGIEAETILIDELAVMMLRNPARFQVIVTNNVFGDIITDLGAELQGGLGMAASGNIKPDSVCMFEPVHGSSARYAGRNVANPMGTMLAAQMMLSHLGWEKEASLIERAVQECVRGGECTQDLRGSLGTREVGEALGKRIRKLAC